MMQEGFYFQNADEAIKFWEACLEAKAETWEEKMIVMRQMVKEKKAKYIRDVEDFAKNKNVLKITQKEDLDD
jgi:hypothetical protein